MKKQQSGFTLIELIVVIVILGILAAVALPKFSSLSEDARIAKMNGLVGSLKAAAAMAHGTSLANQQAGFTGASSIQGLEDGTNVAMQHYYPDAATSGIVLLAGGADYQSAVTASVSVDFYPDSGRTTCVVKYYAASSVAGAAAAPQYDVSAISQPGLCG